MVHLPARAAGSTIPGGAARRGWVRAAPGALALAILLAAASSFASERSDRRIWPSGSRWKRAALTALRDPGTWAPAAGAALLAAADWDARAARWAVRETPLFGSPESARRASDRLRTAAHLAMWATALATPRGKTFWQRRWPRLLIEQAGATGVTAFAGLVKDATNRRRPDGSDLRSFPSGHSTQAFAYARAAYGNLEAARLRPAIRRPLEGLVFGLAAATAWARVEAGVHYPSDVLAGAALGNFASRLVQEAFLEPGTKRLRGRVAFEPGRGAAFVLTIPLGRLSRE